MPSKIDWVTFGENLRKEYGDLSMTHEQLKQARAEANRKKQELDIKRGELEQGIRAQAMKDAFAMDQALHPEKYGVPPSLQIKKAETDIGLTEAEIETEKTKPGYYGALTESTKALGKQREAGGADAKLSLATIETQITQTLKAMTPEVQDMAGRLMNAGSVEEMNALYVQLQPSVPQAYMGLESTDRIMFDRLADLLRQRFRYSTKPMVPTATPAASDTTPTQQGLTPEQMKKIDNVLGL